MRFQDSKEFRKNLAQLPNSAQLQAIEAIEKIEIATNFSDIPHLKPLKGYKNFYRMRVGSYRIGLFWDGQQFIIERIGTRGDFYKTYPPK